MKLSIITVTRNDVEGLKRTISSILQQSFTDYEYIIIDGGSTDGSLEVLKENEAEISCWISEPDKGVYDAMNKGIKMSKGDYCYFLNSGDYLYDKDVLSKAFLNVEDESFIVCDFFTARNGKLQNKVSFANRDWTGALYEIYTGFLCHQAFFIKRDNFDKYGLYDINYIVSDWKLFLLAIGYNQEKVRYSNAELVVYDLDGLSARVHPDIIHSQKEEIIKNLFSPYLYEKLLRYDTLSRQSFWVDFVFCRKWIFFIQRRLVDLCKLLGIVTKKYPYIKPKK